MHPTCTLCIKPDNITVVAPLHAALHEVLDQHGIDITAYCDGMGLCGKCMVEIRLPDGTCPPPTPADNAKLTEAQRAAGLRLACGWRVTGPATIIVPDASRVTAASILVTDTLPAATVSRTVSATRPYGFAVDIGTTTIVASLLDLRTGHTVAVSSALNSQRRFGADVISRINHSLRDGGMADLHTALLDTLNRLMSDCIRQRGIGANAIEEIAFTGNTVMLHTLHGKSMETMAVLPFEPSFRQAQQGAALSLGLSLGADIQAYSFPLIGGFVGGDTVACMLAIGMDTAPALQMVIDIGTNTEVALGCRDGWITASAPAGPAFEGARISCGMNGIAGAIQHVHISPTAVEVDVIGQQAPTGVCGTGLIDAAAALLDCGLLDETGRLCMGDDMPAQTPPWLRRRIIEHEGAPAFILFDPATDAFEQDGSPRLLLLTQRDVRELQLAKGAVAAACDILLRSAQRTYDDICCIHLAGAFGNYLRPATARRIGLLPHVPLEKIEFIGNAASTGTKRALVSMADRARAENLARHAAHIELAADPGFQMCYADHMLFPTVAH